MVSPTLQVLVSVGRLIPLWGFSSRSEGSHEGLTAPLNTLDMFSLLIRLTLHLEVEDELNLIMSELLDRRWIMLILFNYPNLTRSVTSRFLSVNIL